MMSWETAAKKTGWKNWQERKTPRTFAAMKFSRWYVSLRVLLSGNKVLISMKYDSCIRLFRSLSSLVLRTLVAIYGQRNVIKLEDLAPFGENGSMCRMVAFCFSFLYFWPFMVTRVGCWESLFEGKVFKNRLNITWVQYSDLVSVWWMLLKRNLRLC